MDDVFGYLLEKLTEYGILDQTNILLLSDHGNYPIIKNGNDAFKFATSNFHFIRNDWSSSRTIFNQWICWFKFN